jgi:hypothetical protein
MNQTLFDISKYYQLDQKVLNKINDSKHNPGHLSIDDRAYLYTKAFPQFPPLRIWNDRIEDIWFLGQNYQSRSTYYGSYPGNYLKRMQILFPDPSPMLHLFSGSLPEGNYIRFDRKPELEPDVIGSAEELSKYFVGYKFGLIFSDPPYSIEDAEHYGCTLIKRNTVIDECWQILLPGGFLIWLDQVWPQYSKRKWNLYGKIGIEISTNHRSRSVTILQKVGGDE